MRKKILIGLAIFMLALFPIAALADGIVEVLPGSLSVESFDVDFGAWAFSFDERRTGFVTSAEPWTVTDSTDNLQKFDVTLGVSDFDNGSSVFPIDFAEKTVIVNIEQGSIVTLAGDCLTIERQPISYAHGDDGASYLDSSAPLMMVKSYLEACTGSWEFMPEFDLLIPGVMPGVYVSIWDLTISLSVP